VTVEQRILNALMLGVVATLIRGSAFCDATGTWRLPDIEKVKFKAFPKIDRFSSGASEATIF
jgi:hypothetical protein